MKKFDNELTHDTTFFNLLHFVCMRIIMIRIVKNSYIHQ